MNYLINPVKNHVIFGPRELQNSKGHGFATRPLPDLHAAFAAATGGDRKQRIDEASYLYIYILILYLKILNFCCRYVEVFDQV